jgi:hypothetical protein
MESLKVVVQANQPSKVVMQNAPRLLNESGQSPDPCGKQCSFTIVDMTTFKLFLGCIQSCILRNSWYLWRYVHVVGVSKDILVCLQDLIMSRDIVP